MHVRIVVSRSSFSVRSNIDAVAAELGVPVFGKLPLNPAYAQSVDAGEFEQLENPYLDAAVEHFKQL